MNEKYKRLKDSILERESEIAGYHQQLEESKKNADTAQQEIERLVGELKIALASGEAKVRIKALENQLAEQRATLEREQLRAEGIKVLLLDTKAGKIAAEKEADRLLSILAGGWLKIEISVWDDMARELLRIKGRLLACQNILRECACYDTYRAALGLAFQYVSQVKVPIIADFDPSVFINSRSVNPGAHLETVLEEIELREVK